VSLLAVVIVGLVVFRNRPEPGTSAGESPVSSKAAPKPGEIITNSLGMKFAWIPPGTFTMGSPKDELARQGNETQHKVTLTKGFYMGVHLVTREQWQAVMGDIPLAVKGEENLPVRGISWNGCQKFIKKLRGKDSNPYRLPTEAEWEYACRAGMTTTFCFGETISTDQANYNGRAYGRGKAGVDRKKPTPVGSFPPNAWGLYDMPGNCWQWCGDWWGEYPQDHVVDPRGPASGQNRVLRGGSWANGPHDCRSARHNGVGPGFIGPHVGFRLCFSSE
jgi:formylglycine-generating enzyme required for sulfatase activity